MTTPTLSVEEVHKSFGDNEVLKGVSLEVRPHGVVCLIGASGSGKSTLLRCVNLLERVDSGRIVVEGQDITAPGVKVDAVRQKIGIVFQAFNLFPHMTVLRNITLGPREALGLERRAAEDRAMQLLERFGLADKTRRVPGQTVGRSAAARRLSSERWRCSPS